MGLIRIRRGVSSFFSHVLSPHGRPAQVGPIHGSPPWRNKAVVFAPVGATGPALGKATKAAPGLPLGQTPWRCG